MKRDDGLVQAALFSVALGGCSSTADAADTAAPLADADPPRAPITLIEHSAWSRLSETEDPYAEPGLGAEACDQTATSVEGSDPGWYEVVTLICSHLTVSQPSLGDVRAGEQVRIRASHGPLVAPEDRSAGNVAVRVGDIEIWRESVPLPASESRSLEEVWTAPSDVPAGTPIVFHVDNHGTNSWRLYEIVRLPPNGSP